MTASTTTTIRGVSIFSRQRKRKADVFDIALSPEGIAIQRPGRSDQYMGWDRVTQWEIDERPDCVVLTLRGGGSVTPLVVTGWSRNALETVMRETAAGSRGPDATEKETTVPADLPVPAETVPAETVPAETVPAETVGAESVGAESVGAESVGAESVGAESVGAESAMAETVPPTATRPGGEPAIQPRAARRRAARPRRSIWKALVTIVLLGVVATAVVVILLQSAGIISWSFLGPTA